MRSIMIGLGKIDRNHGRFFFVVRALPEQGTERIGYKGTTPKLHGTVFLTLMGRFFYRYGSKGRTGQG